jgi:pimeloyl-ACP methyl ester carboxylesterase
MRRRCGAVVPNLELTVSRKGPIGRSTGELARLILIAHQRARKGASTNGTAPLTIAAMALDALAIMDAQKIERFHVAGHSMGGLIAQEVALLAPACVKSLALLCTFGGESRPRA